MSNPFDEILNELAGIKAILVEQKPTAPEIEIIDIKELEKRIGATRPTINKLRRSGEIPEIRMGSNIRFNWPAVAKALQAKR